MTGRSILRRTCAQTVVFRLVPQNEIPPAMRVDIYFNDASIPYGWGLMKSSPARSKTVISSFTRCTSVSPLPANLPVPA